MSTTIKTLICTVGYLGIALPMLWYGTWRPTLRATRKTGSAEPPVG